MTERPLEASVSDSNNLLTTTQYIVDTDTVFQCWRCVKVGWVDTVSKHNVLSFISVKVSTSSKYSSVLGCRYCHWVKDILMSHITLVPSFFGLWKWGAYYPSKHWDILKVFFFFKVCYPVVFQINNAIYPLHSMLP